MVSWQRVSNTDSIKVVAAAAVTATVAAPAKVDAADFAKQASCYRLLINDSLSFKNAYRFCVQFCRYIVYFDTQGKSYIVIKAFE